MKTTKFSLLLKKLTTARYSSGKNPYVASVRDEQLLAKVATTNIPNPFKSLPNVRRS
jgi:hypothetical protein